MHSYKPLQTASQSERPFLSRVWNALTGHQTNEHAIPWFNMHSEKDGKMVKSSDVCGIQSDCDHNHPVSTPVSTEVSTAMLAPK